MLHLMWQPISYSATSSSASSAPCRSPRSSLSVVPPRRTCLARRTARPPPSWAPRWELVDSTICQPGGPSHTSHVGLLQHARRAAVGPRVARLDRRAGAVEPHGAAQRHRRGRVARGLPPAQGQPQRDAVLHLPHHGARARVHRVAARGHVPGRAALRPGALFALRRAGCGARLQRASATRRATSTFGTTRSTRPRPSSATRSWPPSRTPRSTAPSRTT